MSFDHVPSPVIQLSNSEQFHAEFPANVDNDFFAESQTVVARRSPGPILCSSYWCDMIYALPMFRAFGPLIQTCKAALPLPASIAFILMFGCATWRELRSARVCADDLWMAFEAVDLEWLDHWRTMTALDRWHCISSRCWQFAPKLLQHPALHAISSSHVSFVFHHPHPYHTYHTYRTIMYRPYSPSDFFTLYLC